MMITESIVQKVQEVSGIVKSQSQAEMISELKRSGLLTQPKFNLAYGPQAFIGSNEMKAPQ